MSAQQGRSTSYENATLRAVERVTLTRITYVVGAGREDDPVREVVDYWDDNGVRVARHDGWLDEEVRT